MQKIEYGDILRRAWNITWNNKSFWWLGFFVAIGSGWTGYSSDFSDSEKTSDAVAMFIQNHVAWFIAIVAGMIVVGITLYVLGLFGRAALIAAVNDPIVYAQASIKSLLASGRKFFWRLLALDLVFGLAVFSVILVLVTPVILLFYLKSYILASFAILCALAILVPVLVLTYFMKKYAGFYVVLSDLKFRGSVEFAYELFSKSVKKSLLMGLLSIACSILLSTAILAIILFVGVVFFLVGLLANLLFGNVGIIVIVCLAVALLAVMVVVVVAAFQVFYHAMWVCFYQEISSIGKVNEAAEAEEEDAVSRQIATPEAV